MMERKTGLKECKQCKILFVCSKHSSFCSRAEKNSCYCPTCLYNRNSLNREFKTFLELSPCWKDVKDPYNIEKDTDDKWRQIIDNRT